MLCSLSKLPSGASSGYNTRRHCSFWNHNCVSVVGISTHVFNVSTALVPILRGLHTPSGARLISFPAVQHYIPPASRGFTLSHSQGHEGRSVISTAHRHRVKGRGGGGSALPRVVYQWRAPEPGMVSPVKCAPCQSVGGSLSFLGVGLGRLCPWSALPRELIQTLLKLRDS